MGTNFYIHQKLSQEDKEKVINLLNEDKYGEIKQLLLDYDEIHIGKRSCGWKFLWNSNNFTYFKPNKESLIEFLKRGIIYDEYGETFTFDQFWNEELKGFIENSEIDLWDLEKAYQEEPPKYRHYITEWEKEKFEELGVKPNQYGEFYIDELRFTTCTEFS